MLRQVIGDGEPWQFATPMSGPLISNFTPPHWQLPRNATIQTLSRFARNDGTARGVLGGGAPHLPRGALRLPAARSLPALCSLLLEQFAHVGASVPVFRTGIQ